MTIPELQALPEIIEAGNKLIYDFQIAPSLFDDPGRCIIFTAIASKSADARFAIEMNDTKQFVENALTLLARKHSPFFVEADNEINAANQETVLDDERKLQVYERYTNQELTQQLAEKIQEGFLDDIKERLRVTQENEDAYILRVLDITNDYDFSSLARPKYDETLPWNHPDNKAVEKAQEDMRVLKEDLLLRNQSFAKEMGSMHETPLAWVEMVDGKNTLCVLRGVATAIVNPRMRGRHGEDWEYDISLLQHEYTHTQGGVQIDDDVAFGINIEELRAEYFSGNQHGYTDIKNLFNDYAQLTGHWIVDEFDKHKKGGSATEIYGSIANRIGLSLMLELVMSAPFVYQESQNNRYLAGALEHIAGYDAVLQKILDQEIARGGQNAITERITQKAARLADIDDVTIVESIFNERRRYGLNIVTDLVGEKYKELTTEPGSKHILKSEATQ